MSEILVFVSDDQTRPDEVFQDGDVMFAATERRIHQCHAQTLYNPAAAGFTADGLRTDGLHRYILELVYQYRFERVSGTEIKRTLLIDSSEEILGPTPNARGERIDVPRFIQLRRANPCHRLFGRQGREIWYGGAEDWSAARTALVWDLIEGEAGLDRADYAQWPFSERELHKFLALSTEPMREEIATRAAASEIDYDEEQPEFDPFKDVGNKVARKRRAQVPWRLLGVNVSLVLNPGVRLDLRGAVQGLDASKAHVKPRKHAWSNRAHLEQRSDLWVGD